MKLKNYSDIPDEIISEIINYRRSHLSAKKHKVLRTGLKPSPLKIDQFVGTSWQPTQQTE